MSLLVDNPIINSPFEEPTHHWAYEGQLPMRKEKGRPAGHYFKGRTRRGQPALLEEEFVQLNLFNALR